MSIAWIFPGQGAQSVGMGRDVFVNSAAARATFEQVDDALFPDLGRKLSTLVFDGPEAELTLTKHTQPAIVVTSIALLAAMRERISGLPLPDFVAGHSLGEYSALVAAGGLDVADACRIVHMRGKAMQDAVPPDAGAMSAVMGLAPAVVESLCRQAASETGEIVSPANFNAPGQIVIAGTTKAVSAAGVLVAANKGKAIPLKVSAPFHCALMRPATEVVRTKLAAVTLRAPLVPVVSNVDATPRSNPREIADALVRQVDAPVRWSESVSAMIRGGVTHFIEIGPGKVLQGLVKRVAKEESTQPSGEKRDIHVTGVSDVGSLDVLPAFLAGC